MWNNNLEVFVQELCDPCGILEGLLSSHTPVRRIASEDSGRHRERLDVPISLLA